MVSFSDKKIKISEGMFILPKRGQHRAEKGTCDSRHKDFPVVQLINGRMGAMGMENYFNWCKHEGQN